MSRPPGRNPDRTQDRALEPLRAVLGVLRTAGPLTRADLGGRVGLSRTTVSGVLTDLRRVGLVDEDMPVGRPVTGRPAALVRLTATAGLAVGVDVGRRHLRVVVADLGHRVLAEDVHRFDVDDRPEETYDAVAALLDGLLAGLPAGRRDVLGIGLGIPAPLDGRGAVGSSSILPGWLGRLPGPELSTRLGVPVRTDNDANLGALAEAVWGAGRGCSELVYVKAATGVGAGIVHGGQLLRGASGTAGEVGHTTVVVGGELCRCGNRGCLEMYVGGPALVARLAHAGTQVASVPELVARAQGGDPACVRVLADAGDEAGQALANLVNIVNPERLVFGGELGVAGELLLTSLRARVLRAAVPSAASCLSVVPSLLGARAEALGGVLLVLREPDPFSERLVARALEALQGSAAQAS